MLAACGLPQGLVDVLRVSDGRGDLEEFGVSRDSCCLQTEHVV